MSGPQPATQSAPAEHVSGATGSLDLEEGYRALREVAGASYWERDVVRVFGPDAASYLQGQTSQDVVKLATGEWAWALVLQPQGKLDAFVRVHRAGPDEFLLDSDSGTAEALVTRLLRFRLRTKVDVEALSWQFLAVRGPAAFPPPTGSVPGTAVIGFSWGGLEGYDLAGPTPGAANLPTLAVASVPPEAFDALLVEAGFPRHGTELDERTIPAEAGLVEAAVSFTKGCYTGQELVARIDSRGNNVPRRLWGLVADAPVAPGDQLYATGPGEVPPPGSGGSETSEATTGTTGPAGPRAVGRVTRAAVSPRLGPVALCYLGRGIEAGATVWAQPGAPGPAVAARVRPLPMSV